jgi:hypothetical protein
MAGDRAFDDGRWPDQDGHTDCFICTHAVDPLDSNRGSYEIFPFGPRLPIHLRCAAGKSTLVIEHLYRQALVDMERRQRAIVFGR